jgi:cytidylate kinase
MISSQTAEHQLPILITVQGQARSGKGTLAGALKSDFSVDYNPLLIDQGLKFRIIAEQFLRDGGNIEDIEGIGGYLLSSGYRTVLGQLAVVAGMDKQEIQEVYYTEQINNASGMVGKSPVAQAKVVELLIDEVKTGAQTHDLIILDGRAMLEKGRKLQAMGIVRYPLAIDVKCSSLVAAQRITDLVKPVEELTLEEAKKLLIQVSDIDKRNSSDARRDTYPSLPISGAFEFDVTHNHSSEELAQACEEAFANGAISLDNSYTRQKNEFTVPAIKLVRCVLAKLT